MDDGLIAGVGPAAAAAHQAAPAAARTGRRGGRTVAASRARAAVPTAAAGGRGGGGRGRKRPREPEPPLPQPEEENDDTEPSSGSASEGATASDEPGSSGDEGQEAQGPGQAAAAAAPHAAAAVPQLSVREQALQLLVGTGVPQQRAQQAIAAVLEDAKGQEPEVAVDWAELAQVWLACQAEFEDERDQLAEAMQVSLEEAEERKKQQKPLEERTPEEIQQEFVGSEMLHCLAARHSLESLLAPPLREALLAYLQLEKRCQKWYSIACHYFEASAIETVQMLGGEVKEGDCCSEPAAKRQRLESQRQAGGSGGGSSSANSSALPAIDDDAATVLMVSLESRRQIIQQAVYAMPADSSVQVPELFTDAVPEGAEPECISVDSDSEDEQQQQQQQPDGQQQQQAGE